MTDLTASLNREQHAAVTLPHQHALILAGAGSGKTRVLTTRIAWLINHDRAPAHAILAVTFTNKAAKEMQTRLAALVPFSVRGMWLGTFHGLCNRFLRTHFREAGLPEQFQILDSADQLAAIKRLMKNLSVDEERFPPRELAGFINRHKEQGERPGSLQGWDRHSQKQIELWAEYESQCQREGVVDFAELLLRCYELLQRHEPLRRHYQERFQHILIDEFQDTNRLQYQWLRLLAQPENPSGARVFAVGDDDQSIYAFRGAEVGNMREFERQFSVKSIIRLEQNYRSHGHILESANALIARNRDRLGKNLWTDTGDGELIRVYQAFSDLDEARFISDEIRERQRSGTPLTQIAILYRSNAQSRVLEHQLFTSGLPYRVYGGLRFFDRQEIKHVLAYLRLIANPDDDTAFLRIVNVPARGIGARTLESIQSESMQKNTSLYNAGAGLSGKSAIKVREFIGLIERLRNECRSLSLPEQVQHVIHESGIHDYYQKEREAQERRENLDELINAATAFLQEDHEHPTEENSDDNGVPVPRDPLAAFLAHASLESGERQSGEGDEAVQLMTVHAAKGLEFDQVFITGLEQGLFPHENALLDSNGMEEERRLMYVAMTRARQHLTLCHAQTRLLHGQTRYCVPSCYLEELPQQRLKFINRLPERSTHSASSFSALDPEPQRYPSRQSQRTGFGRSPASLSSRAGSYRIGQQVEHSKFGLGTVLALEGAGEDERVQVNFRQAGVKWLAVPLARLQVV